MNRKRNPWENSLLENNFISLLESEKRTTASEENCLETFRWKTFRKNLAAYEKQKRKIAESYPLLSESHHLTKSDDEGFFYLFPAPAGSDAPAEGFSFRFREVSLLAGILLAFYSCTQANVI